MTKIPNNVIKPPPGFEYVTVEKNHTNSCNKKPIKDDTKKRIEYLESKMDKFMDELRVLKRKDKYRPKPE